MPACTFHPFANERSRRTICSPSLCFFSADICCSFHIARSGFLAARVARKIQPVFKKREKEKGVGKREGCATWFRVLYPCVSCEEGWMGIKESRKMNVSHEHHSFVPGRFHSFTFHPSPALFLSRASVLHACPFEWKLVSNHRGIPLD